MDSLSARVIENAVVYPTIRVASRPNRLLMGVFDGNGTYVEDTVLNRRFGEQGAPMPRDLFPVITDATAPAAIYAGPLYYHFGHFLLESLARVWYAVRHPDLPLVWAGQHDWQKRVLKPWQLEILELLGLRNPTVITADPTRYATLHVPDIGYRYDDRFHPEHAAFLGRYEGPPQVSGHRIWLSRSQLGSDVRDLNAEPTERRLREAGWTVLHAEKLSIREQLDQLAEAEVVAGEEGSAFHTAVLLKDLSEKQFRIFRRYGREHQNLHTIGDARGMTQHFHSLDRELVLHAVGRVVSKINPNASEILDVLGVAVPSSRATPDSTGADRIDRVLAELAPESFLDIGATGPALIVRSTATVRVAVSPRFGFDPRTYADEGIDFYELGLERYVELFHRHRRPFDVIRVSGPTFDEVMARFTASKALAGDGTIWILGYGAMAARAALAVRLTHPGYAATRLLVGRRTVFVARRDPTEPIDDAAVGDLPAEEVRKRTRWLRPTRWVLPQRLSVRGRGSQPRSLSPWRRSRSVVGSWRSAGRDGPN